MTKYTQDQVNKIEANFKLAVQAHIPSDCLGRTDTMHGEVVRAVDALVARYRQTGASEFYIHAETNWVASFAGYLAMVNYLNPYLSSAVHNTLTGEAYGAFLVELQQKTLDFLNEVPNEPNIIDSSACEFHYAWDYSECDTCKKYFPVADLENDGLGSCRCSECINDEMIAARKNG